MDSQTTYELASQGLIRPANSALPVIYGIKCVHFDPPNFTLGKLYYLVFKYLDLIIYIESYTFLYIMN